MQPSHRAHQYLFSITNTFQSPLRNTWFILSHIYFFLWPCCAAISRQSSDQPRCLRGFIFPEKLWPFILTCQTLHLAQLNFVLFPLFPPSRSHSSSCLIGWGLSVLTSACMSVSSGNLTVHSSLFCVTEKYGLKAIPRQPSDKSTSNCLPDLLSVHLAFTSYPTMPHLSCRDGWGSSGGKDGASL